MRLGYSKYIKMRLTMRTYRLSHSSQKLIIKMSTYIKKKPTYRRKRAREPMVDGDVNSAEAVTHTRIAVPQDDGSMLITEVLESLDSTPPVTITEQRQPNAQQDDVHEYEQMNISPPQSPQPKKSRVCDINQFNFVV